MDKFIYRERINASRSIGTPSFSGLFDNIITKGALLAVSVFLLYNVAHSINITIQKLDILKRAEMEVDVLRLKNLELAMLLENMQSREYLEVQARDRLNFAGEREYVFVIPDSVLEGAQDDMEKLLSADGRLEREPTYEIWMDFLLKGI